MSDPILILHGWGSTMSGERYSKVKELLQEEEYAVFVPDLPGFGKNTLKKEALTFDDYLLFVKDFIQEKKLKKIILVGHSFGGRIAIAFAAKYPELVSKLILVSASGIPHPLSSLKKKIAYVVTKIIGPIFAIPPLSLFYNLLRKLMYYSIGEMDYYKSGNLKQTFKNVYQVSIVPDLEKITVKTLILWGEIDTFTLLKDGKLMHECIKNSQLVIIHNAGHKFIYENPEKFVKEVLKFIT